MKIGFKYRLLSAALAGGACLAMATVPSLAATPAETVAALADKITPVTDVNKGDTAWLLVSTLLVLMMSLPGLALFYGGLVRTKNMLSILTQIFAIVSIVTLIWVFYGYSMAFTGGNGASADFVGGFTKIFLKGIAPEGKTIADGVAATFSNGFYVPELAYMAFQMTFACITPALIVGAFAERMRFSALILFIVLWMTVIYFPIAHMVWYNAGPDGFAKGALVAKLFEGSAGRSRRSRQGVRRHRRSRSWSRRQMGRDRFRRRNRRPYQRRASQASSAAFCWASASATARS